MCVAWHHIAAHCRSIACRRSRCSIAPARACRRRCATRPGATSRSRTRAASCRSAAPSPRFSMRSGLDRPHRRGRHHEPLSGRGAEAEAERRLHARALGRRRAGPQSLAGAGDRRRRPEGDDRGARSRRRAAGARAGPLHGDGIIEKIRMVADVDRRAAAAARCLACQVGGRSRGARRRCARRSRSRSKVMFVLSFLNGKPMVAGRNTAADGIITLAGAVNAIDAYEGYKQISDEAVIAASPDTVLVMQRQQRQSRRRRPCSRIAAFTMTPAAAQQILHRDGRALSARLRPAHRGRGARSRGAALSRARPRGAAVRAAQPHTAAH